MQLLKIFLLALAFQLTTGDVSATEQQRDLLVVGGRTFAIEQQPMLALWKSPRGIGDGEEQMPPFMPRYTSNHRGYVANFTIKDNRFYLHELEGEVIGRPEGDRHLFNRPLPIVARWFTGSVFAVVGDVNKDNRASRYVIEFKVAKGMVRKTDYHEELRIPRTWNGARSPASPNVADE